MEQAHLQLPAGMFNLAVCYAKGRGLNQPDLARAVELYTKATDQVCASNPHYRT
jgi:TPR repeat protein